MSRDDSLAGLTEAIAGHEDYYWNRETHTTHCDCGHKHGDGLMVTGVAAIHRAHVAAVALAWLEGHGWAEGAEEWGVRIKLSPVRSTTQRHKTEESARAEVEESMRPDLLTLVRRHVSAWAPVETGEAP